MKNRQPVDLPVRAGVYADVVAARRAVSLLQAAGFGSDQITVVCSDESKERHFESFRHQEPAGKNSPAVAAAGGATGATVGGIATGALGLAVGGPALVVLGGAGLITGAVVGTFLGAMLSRGTEKEAADFYDQAVERGKLLVVVEIHQPGADERLAVAERLLADAGAEPLPLPEG
jgi:hypothetical protein